MLNLSSQGEIIHYRRDALGGILVIDYRKHRILTFDSVFEQSKIDRRNPHLPVHEYNRAMLLPAAFREPRHATVMGLGGGVIAGALHYLFPDCDVHAIELRQAVVDVAHEYFSLPRSHRLHITVGDARTALEDMPENSTDLVLADLYMADRMSPAQTQRHFIDLCSHTLGHEGWLVMNYHRSPDQNSPVLRQLRKHFAAILVFTSKTNNIVIYASKQPFDAFHSRDPHLKALEQRLPVGWEKLMGRVVQLP